MHFKAVNFSGIINTPICQIVLITTQVQNMFDVTFHYGNYKKVKGGILQ